MRLQDSNNKRYGQYKYNQQARAKNLSMSTSMCTSTKRNDIMISHSHSHSHDIYVAQSRASGHDRTDVGRRIRIRCCVVLDCIGTGVRREHQSGTTNDKDIHVYKRVQQHKHRANNASSLKDNNDICMMHPAWAVLCIHTVVSSPPQCQTPQSQR